MKSVTTKASLSLFSPRFVENFTGNEDDITASSFRLLLQQQSMHAVEVSAFPHRHSPTHVPQLQLFAVTSQALPPPLLLLLLLQPELPPELPQQEVPSWQLLQYSDQWQSK